MSTGVAAMKMPLNPPMMKSETNATAFNSADVNWMFPCHSVPIQLNTFTADGRAIIMVETMKPIASIGFIPLINIWWAHTMNPSPAMPATEYTMGRYPNNGLRENVEIMSETIPIAGRIMM